MMKRLIFILLLGFVISCTNKNNDCFKTQGAEVTKEIPISSFKKVTVDDRLNMVLIKSNKYKAEVRGGEYIIDDVVSMISGDQHLKFVNNNSCKWLRSRKDFMTIYLYAPQFDSVFIEGEGKLSNQDTLKEDFLYVFGKDSNGEIDLTIDAKDFYLKLESYSFVNIDGKSNYSYLYNFGGSLVDLSNLASNDAYIWHQSTGETRVRASSTLKGQNRSVGEVYIYGNPSVVDLEKFPGGGKVINQ